MGIRQNQKAVRNPQVFVYYTRTVLAAARNVVAQELPGEESENDSNAEAIPLMLESQNNSRELEVQEPTTSLKWCSESRVIENTGEAGVR